MLLVQVWRELCSLGALHLQQSVCLLPARPEVVREVRRLADRFRHQGGTARVLSMVFTEPAEEHAVIAELNAARDAEYDEVEESEADLEGFRTWLSKIAARDYFAIPGCLATRDAVEEAAAELAAFEEISLRAEAPGSAPAGASAPRLLRVVDQP